MLLSYDDSFFRVNVLLRQSWAMLILFFPSLCDWGTNSIFYGSFCLFHDNGHWSVGCFDFIRIFIPILFCVLWSLCASSGITEAMVSWLVWFLASLCAEMVHGEARIDFASCTVQIGAVVILHRQSRIEQHTLFWLTWMPSARGNPNWNVEPLMSLHLMVSPFA